MLPDETPCVISGAVYRIQCELCGLDYIGETGRTLFVRLTEHYNYANNPTAKSYVEKTMATHYATQHNKVAPAFKFEVLAREQNTLRRKVKEAYFIRSLKPALNEKQEMDQIKKFLL